MCNGVICSTGEINTTLKSIILPFKKRSRHREQTCYLWGEENGDGKDRRRGLRDKAIKYTVQVNSASKSCTIQGIQPVFYKALNRT